MAIIVVGGNGKDIGKTAFVCGLIAALAEFRWTAVKITGHGHGKPDPIWEESRAGQETDTARYLAAGAHRALLVARRNGRIPLRKLWHAVGPGANLIIESNAIAARLRPDLTFAVVGSSAPGEPVKPSFQGLLHRADAAVVLGNAVPKLGEIDPALPIFHLQSFARITPRMLSWMRRKLGAGLAS